MPRWDAPTGRLGAKDSPPASRVLGYEIRERLLPMGQEVYALGNVAWRFRASVGISQGDSDIKLSRVVKVAKQIAKHHPLTLTVWDDYPIRSGQTLGPSSDWGYQCGAPGEGSVAVLQPAEA